MQTSGFFKLNLSDWQKGLVMAILVGFALPLDAAIHTQGFNLFALTGPQIGAILGLAVNGAFIGLFTYIGKNLLTDSSGRFLRAIGGVRRVS